MIRVAYGKGVGERVMVGNIAAGKVSHGDGALGRHPLVVLAAVPGRVGAGPVMREVFKELQAEIRCGGMKRQNVAGVAIGLVPDGLAVGQHNGTRIAVASNPAQRAEVVIKGPVLLHHDDDVLHIFDSAGFVVCRDREGASDAGGEGSGSGGSGQKLEECTAIGGHVALLRQN